MQPGKVLLDNVVTLILPKTEDVYCSSMPPLDCIVRIIFQPIEVVNTSSTKKLWYNSPCSFFFFFLDRFGLNGLEISFRSARFHHLIAIVLSKPRLVIQQ